MYAVFAEAGQLISLSRVLGGHLPSQRAQLVETTVRDTVLASTFSVIEEHPDRKRPRRRKQAA